MDIASVYGDDLPLPQDDAEPEDVLRAAEAIGAAIRDRRPRLPDTAWTPLPVRSGVAARDRHAAVERLLAWAQERGATWSGIEIVVGASGGASVRATRAIANGETVLGLPRDAMIVDDELARTAAGDVGVAPGRDALAAWLPLEAREAKSPWRAYLDALPAHIPELPMYRADLRLLAGTAAHDTATAHARDVQASYAALPDPLRARVSLAEFAWGCALLRSRAFHAPGSFEPKIALMPVVDLFDHGLGDLTWSYDPLDPRYVLAAERDIAAGEPVYFPYGTRSDSYLLAHFGFTLEDNPAAEADLTFERGTDPAVDVAAHLLWKVPLVGPARVRVRGTSDRQLERAVSFARLAAADPAARSTISFAPNASVPWLGEANDARAFAMIAAAAERSLAQLGDHPEPDSLWARHCARVRDGERRLLRQIADLAAARIPAKGCPVTDRVEGCGGMPRR